jgi:hypothetical protein
MSNAINLTTAFSEKLTMKELNRIDEIIKETYKEMGDKGSCVLGMCLKVNGKKLVDQICQGSLTNEVIFDRIKNLLELRGKRITIDYGIMD